MHQAVNSAKKAVNRDRVKRHHRQPARLLSVDFMCESVFMLNSFIILSFEQILVCIHALLHVYKTKYNFEYFFKNKLVPNPILILPWFICWVLPDIGGQV